MFLLGDTVTWSSQSAGIHKAKTGVIVAVIRPGERAPVHNPGLARDHESYLVNVDGRRYWPRVAALKAVR